MINDYRVSKESDYIELISGEYAGIKFKFDGVSFDEKEENGEMVGYMNYNYDLESQFPPNLDIKLFETALGDFLIELLRIHLAEGSTVFKGGVD